MRTIELFISHMKRVEDLIDKDLLNEAIAYRKDVQPHYFFLMGCLSVDKFMIDLSNYDIKLFNKAISLLRTCSSRWGFPYLEFPTSCLRRYSND